MSADDVLERLQACAREAANGIVECLRMSVRACLRPFRHARPLTAFFVLILYAGFCSVSSWLTVELDASDALDIEFASASIPLKCTVLEPEEDDALQQGRSFASQYLGIGVRIDGIDSETCELLCTDREWSSGGDISFAILLYAC